MPDDPLQLYRQATTDVAAFDLSAFGKLVLRGKDAASFLQNFTTNDVVKPGPGSGCEAFVLTAQAKVVAWIRVAIGKDELYLHTDPGLVPRLREHLERHQIAEQVEFEDRTEADCLWHVCGPGAGSNLKPLGLNVDQLQPWQHVEVDLQGDLCRVQRADFVGMPGMFVTLSRTATSRFAQLCTEKGISVSTLSNPVWTMLRVEAGTPVGGVDFDETNLPQEVNRTEQAISFAKGCYLGQETVARIRAYGHVNRQLVPVMFPTKTELMIPEWPAWNGAVVKHGEKEVGRVRSVAFSPRLGCWLAFALLRREHVKPGTSLEATSAAGEAAPVEVTIWSAGEPFRNGAA